MRHEREQLAAEVRREGVAMDLPRLDAALEDGGVRLRPWTYDDLGCVREAGLDPSITESTTVPARYSDPLGREFVERQWARTVTGQGWSLVIAEASTDEALGCAVLMLRPQSGVAGIGYWLVPRARGQRYGSRAVALLTAWGLAEAGMERIEAWVEPDNVASARLLEGCGYVLEGRLRSFLAFPSRRADALVFSRLRTD